MSASTDDIGAMLQARAAQGTDDTDIGSLLAKRAAGGLAPTVQPKPASTPPTALSRFGQGFTDLPFGLAQITEHVAETPLNWLRAVIRKDLNAAGAHDAADWFAPVSTSDFDDIVKDREQSYQQARADAQQNGIDWWRLAGSVPVALLAPEGAAATSLGRIAAGAAQGAAVGAAQPSTIPGNFWWDKARDAVTGAAAGGALSSAVEGTIPLIKTGLKAARNALGGSAKAAQTAAADAVVNSALQAKNVDLSSLSAPVIAALKQEAQDALEHGVAPSPAAIAARAKAESLPFPIRFTRGQLHDDAMQFSDEQNVRGIKGVGEPITQRLTEQNAAMINNLDALGAKDAADPVSLGQTIAEKVQSHWDDLQSQKDALYAAVRNSKGQPAAMDQFTAMKNIRDALDTPEVSHAFDSLPANIQRTIGDLEDGKLPLTVGQMQSLDKLWGTDQRAASGTAAYAIGTARRLLNEAPIADDVGEEARQAYQAARAAHAQQMALVDPKLPNGMPNPKYQPLVDSVVYGGQDPATVFTKHFMNATPNVAGKNLRFVSSLDPSLTEQVGKTYMGEVKRLALSSASDERGTVSNAVLTGFARDPVKAARMDALMPKPAVQTFRNLADSVEKAKRFPVASTVSTSNSNVPIMNVVLSLLKNSGLAQVSKRLPGVKMTREGLEEAANRTTVNQALNPGVTLESLLKATPSQAARRQLTTRLAIPATVAASTKGSTNEP